MPRFNAVIDIDAPLDHVFAMACDPLKQPDWTTWIKECTITSGDGKSAGTTEKATIKVNEPQSNILTFTPTFASGSTGASPIGLFSDKDKTTPYISTPGSYTVEKLDT